MSDFTGISKLKENVFNLTDEEIKKIYFDLETENGKYSCGYILHIPKTYSDKMLNSKNF